MLVLLDKVQRMELPQTFSEPLPVAGGILQIVLSDIVGEGDAAAVLGQQPGTPFLLPFQLLSQLIHRRYRHGRRGPLQLHGHRQLRLLVGVHTGIDLLLCLQKAFQQPGIEFPALAAADHGNGFFPAEGFFIHPVADQSIVDVGQRNHLGPNGDGVPFQTVGIALAVPALVMVAADVVAILIQAALQNLRHMLQDLTPAHGVLLHDLKLLAGELAGFVENGVGNGDLAHVVHDRRLGDQGNILGQDAVFRILFHQFFQNCGGQVADTLDMLAAFAVQELNDRGQGIDDGAVQLLQLSGLSPQLFCLGLQGLLLGLYQAAQLAPGVEQLHDIADSFADQLRHKGLVDHVHGAQFVGFAQRDLVFFRCDEKHRDFVQKALSFELLQYCKAIHFRHHKIQQNRLHLVAAGCQLLQSLAAVFRLQDLVVLFKGHSQQRPVQLHVIRDENPAVFHCFISPTSFPFAQLCRGKRQVLVERRCSVFALL